MGSPLRPSMAGSGVTLIDQDTARPATPSTRTAARRVTSADRWFASLVRRTTDAAAVRLELWDGTSDYNGSGPPIGDLVVRSRRTLLGLALNPDLWFGEGYMGGDLEIRGPFQHVLDALSRVSLADPSWRESIAAGVARANSLTGSRRNVHHHYDLGNAFYERWLDREMVYTCAYYPDPQTPLEQAQKVKLDLVCRKLRLRRDETVVEAGCGWGALALHMAREYGARVKAFNVSREQLTYARERAAREGLAARVEFIDDDYRNVSGRFDAFVSVGMLEHVGLRHFQTLGDVLRRSLRRDGGRGLLHFIGRDVPRPVNAWIRRRIFPGGYMPTLAEVTTRVLGPAGMSVIDVENLRLHYARTLADWSTRFASVKDWVCASYGDEFQRAWELYLAGSQAAFTTGWLQLFQIVVTPRESAPPSWTRRDTGDAPEMSL
jgi:cyclopropane-fatty-acyl-phospholipid synthase